MECLFPRVAKAKEYQEARCIAGYNCMHLRNAESEEPINLQKVYRMGRRLVTLEEELKIFRKSCCGTKSSIDEKIATIEALKYDNTVAESSFSIMKREEFSHN